MRTLYVRFVAVTICIMLFSGLVAFLLSNALYQVYLKPKNDEKITAMLQEVQRYANALPEQETEAYLQNIAALGYQLCLDDGQGARRFYGSPFRDSRISAGVVQEVQRGMVYHGIRELPRKRFVTGFFEDKLANSIGMPVQIGGKTYALFLRPDIGKQFWEMRIFFSLLLVGAVVFSIVLVMMGARYIVKPITTLTKATKKLAAGQYDIALEVNRRDEIGTLAQQFSQMAVSLGRLEQMRQEFVANVSHEIQSPLTSIQGYARVLRSQQLSAEQRAHYLAIIEEESRRMSLLSKQMLLLASLDQEEGVAELQEFDVAGQLHQVVRATEWQWRERELAIELELEPAVIRGNKDFLYHVWMNLLTNSIKFTEPGGTILIRTERENRGETRVRIQDTGIGMTEEHLQRIFEPYYKADISRNRERGGSGLGLAIAKKVVALHGGTIAVVSEPGAGTVFTVTLPHL